MTSGQGPVGRNSKGQGHKLGTCQTGGCPDTNGKLTTTHAWKVLGLQEASLREAILRRLSNGTSSSGGSLTDCSSTYVRTKANS